MQNELAFIPSTVRQILFLFHGYGSNGADMMGLGQELGLKDTAIFTPNGPYSTGFGGYEWFDAEAEDFMPLNIQTLTKLTQKAQKVVPTLQKQILNEADQFHLRTDKIILGGFSQGGMMALLTALQTKGISKVMGLSAVPPDLDHISISNTPQILLTHGEDDGVVPLKALQYNIASLKKNGLNLRVFLSPNLEHGINMNCIQEIRSFLAK